VRLARESTNLAAAHTNVSVKRTTPKQIIQVSTNILVRTNFEATAPPQTAAPTISSNAIPSAPPAATGTNSAAPAPSPSPFSDLKLQSIIYRNENPVALINGQMVLVGDEVRKARVVKIDRRSIVVERNGETNEMRLPRL